MRVDCEAYAVYQYYRSVQNLLYPASYVLWLVFQLALLGLYFYIKGPLQPIHGVCP